MQLDTNNDYLCSMKFATLNRRNRTVTLQLIGWGVIIATSLFWSVDSNLDSLDAFGIASFTINLSVLLAIYLVNYSLFIPKFLFNKKRNLFLGANLLLIVILLLSSYYTNEKGILNDIRPDNLPPRPKSPIMYLVRDFISYVLMIGLVTAFKLSRRLQLSEEALKEAENARVKAELANLRSQINPHFLLNTLNNIYALTTIDTDKAQKAIKELSSLLRYILYENPSNRVSLRGEVEFIKTYIELMSIRLPRKVKVTTHFNFHQQSTTQIAPLIFISLIENAFKHSVSANGEGFIDILFEEKISENKVILSIKNSNNAKADEDKSGHGIGLEQVGKRLELLYKGNYNWDVKQTEKEYSSTIILNTSEQ